MTARALEKRKEARTARREKAMHTPRSARKGRGLTTHASDIVALLVARAHSFSGQVQRRRRVRCEQS